MSWFSEREYSARTMVDIELNTAQMERLREESDAHALIFGLRKSKSIVRQNRVGNSRVVFHKIYKKNNYF